MTPSGLLRESCLGLDGEGGEDELQQQEVVQLHINVCVFAMGTYRYDGQVSTYFWSYRVSLITICNMHFPHLTH